MSLPIFLMDIIHNFRYVLRLFFWYFCLIQMQMTECSEKSHILHFFKHFQSLCIEMVPIDR